MKKDNSLVLNDNEISEVDLIHKDIKEKVINARSKMLKQIDITMIEVYWYVGKITSELYKSSSDGTYGKRIIEALSKKLTDEFGTGFSSVSIRRMRRFYEFYPNWSAVPTELSWSHFQELIRIERKEEREFYQIESIKSNWGYRELGRQINTKLYDRYLISPDKNLIMTESKKDEIEKQPDELLKNPYIFEFVGLKENRNYLESDLEESLLNHLIVKETSSGYGHMSVYSSEFRGNLLP